MILTRRNFNALGVTAAGAAAMLPSWLPATAAATAATDKPFHFAVVSDTHVIDKFYKPGSENGFEDNDSIMKANDRLIAARDTVNGIRFKDGSKIENVFMPGDIFHNYPSADYDFYFKNETRIDIAKQIIDGFHAPVHLGFGNHDYDEHGKPGVSIAMSNRLIKEKLKSDPYSAVDYNGFRFVILNNFLGKTWDQGGDKRLGSLGEEQLQWAEAQFAARKPTVVFIHYPLWLVAPTEVKDFGLHPLLQKYKDTIQIVIAGHWHKWVDFAHTYGPQHTVTAATRYDPNAFMIFRADAKRGRIEWVDERRVEWSTHFAKPYSNV